MILKGLLKTAQTADARISKYDTTIEGKVCFTNGISTITLNTFDNFNFLCLHFERLRAITLCWSLNIYVLYTLWMSQRRLSKERHWFTWISDNKIQLSDIFNTSFLRYGCLKDVSKERHWFTWISDNKIQSSDIFNTSFIRYGCLKDVSKERYLILWNYSWQIIISLNMHTYQKLKNYSNKVLTNKSNETANIIH